MEKPWNSTNCFMPTTSLMGNRLKNNSDLRKKTLGLWTKFHIDHYSDLCLLRC